MCMCFVFALCYLNPSEIRGLHSMECSKFAIPRYISYVYRFSRHIELYLYNAKLNQTSRKPQNSVILAVTSSFQVSSTGRKQFSASTADLKTTFHSHQW